MLENTDNNAMPKNTGVTPSTPIVASDGFKLLLNQTTTNKTIETIFTKHIYVSSVRILTSSLHLVTVL